MTPAKWARVNARRGELIVHRLHGLLTPSERAELVRLNAAADKHLATVDRARDAALQLLERFARRLRLPRRRLRG